MVVILRRTVTDIRSRENVGAERPHVGDVADFFITFDCMFGRHVALVTEDAECCQMRQMPSMIALKTGASGGILRAWPLSRAKPAGCQATRKECQDVRADADGIYHG